MSNGLRELAKIVIFGVGNGGGNALFNIAEKPIPGIDYIAINTEKASLERIKTRCQTFQIGEKLTRGFGVGNNAELARKIAVESEHEIQAYMENADIVIVVASLGGGTGSGAAPVVAGLAKSKGILTISVVSVPFDFEGRMRLTIAQDALNKICDNSDAYIVISNQLLLNSRTNTANIGFVEAFKIADNVTSDAVNVITDLIKRPGLINIDLNDFRTILKDSGLMLIGIGYGEGDNRAIDAANQAINSPLLTYNSIKGAKGMIVNIAGSEKELKLVETERATSLITSQAAEKASIKFGVSYIEELDKKIRISVIISNLKKKID